MIIWLLSYNHTMRLHLKCGWREEMHKSLFVQLTGSRNCYLASGKLHAQGSRPRRRSGRHRLFNAFPSSPLSGVNRGQYLRRLV